MNISRAMAVVTVTFMLLTMSAVASSLWGEFGLERRSLDAGFFLIVLLIWAITPYVGMALLALRIGRDQPASSFVLLIGAIVTRALGLASLRPGSMERDALNVLAALFGPMWQWGGCRITSAIAIPIGRAWRRDDG